MRLLSARMNVSRSAAVKPYLPPGVIRGFDLDRAQCDDRGARNNSYFLTVDRSGQPFAQVPFRVGDGQRCHKPNINPLKGSVKTVNRLLMEPIRGGRADSPATPEEPFWLLRRGLSRSFYFFRSARFETRSLPAMQAPSSDRLASTNASPAACTGALVDGSLIPFAPFSFSAFDLTFAPRSCQLP